MIIPVLLVGGSGTRLWPVSRKSYPKQFTAFDDGPSLFQQTVTRLNGPGFAPPMVTTQADFRFIVAQQLEEIGVRGGDILVEPSSRNTAPAILAAAVQVARTDPDAVMLVAPSDHAIRDPDGFLNAVQQGARLARQGRIVTFGIVPDRPETGFGYLELDGPAIAGQAAALLGFVEKPDRETAARMAADGRHLWNAGVFMFTARSLMEAFEQHAPDFMSPVQEAVLRGQGDLDFFKLAAEPWMRLPDQSIDYAVMERASGLCVVPLDVGWSDLGGWDGLWRQAGGGVVTGDRATAIDCEDVFLMSQAPDMEVVGVGLRNLVAVATKDAVLVADMDHAQDVRLAVSQLRDRDCPQADRHSTDHRPWGWFETLVLGERFRVKRIHVHPGAALSLQSHVHRAEHWVVVSGTARVTIGNDVRLLGENQSVYVPLGEIHRLENPGRLPVVLIEVQTGAYLGEDDITRYEDVYARDTVAAQQPAPRLRVHG